MAVTQGHGNPKWNRDETILAFDVYLKNRGRSLGPNDAAIIELSEAVRALPYHGETARKDRFRNAAGAAFKVQNLRSIETGKGLSNVSAMDRQMWTEFGGREAEVARLAALIRQGAKEPSANADLVDDSSEDVEFYEGRLLTRLHRLRERDARVRRKLLDARKGNLRCEICGGTHDHLPVQLRSAAFDAHHNIAIASAGERATRIADMSLLCATCHRLLHRAIALRREWVTVGEARSLLTARGR